MTTTNSMNYLLEENTVNFSVKMPESMRRNITKAAKKRKMNNSKYVKYCISKQLERDILK